MLPIHEMAPMMLKAMNCLKRIPPTPAITGAKVRMTGMNWASTIVLRPYFS